MLKAIKEGDEEALKAMIKAGKNLAEPNKEGWLPLHEAAYYGQLRCLKALQQGEGTALGAAGGGSRTPGQRVPPSGASCSLLHRSWQGWWSQAGSSPHCRAEITRLGEGSGLSSPPPPLPSCHLCRPFGTGEPNS